MATATSTSAAKATRNPARIAAYVLLGVLAVAVLWFAFNFASIKGQARVGASYAAHVGCSCRYIEGRDLKSCRTDFEPGMGMISLTDDPAHKRITASVPFLAKAIAERRGANGCLQLNDKEMEDAD